MLDKLSKLNQLLTRADKVAIISIILCSGLLIILTPQLVSGAQGNKDIVVKLAEQEIYRHNLSKEEKLKRVKFNFDFKGESYQGVLRIKNGKVKLERLNKNISPLAIHSEMGWISKPYQMIVCLPVKLTVTIESNNSEQNDIDVRTF
ncbi:NusG domain II-containing protein [Halanaerobacter jeridensis]|uniref:NusG domain-containing protein n=1 Tax=Halanaerobacter jeridensis TaxID=706427 RepID=A0A939BT93_9FIRM|nr:NusG domain II-containing protein [Halanaerobacter jeridensis]MBM7558006.1 hypothetical protein [Halanaerobacter jeridensis]